jgi:hypothetical protein
MSRAWRKKDGRSDIGLCEAARKIDPFRWIDSTSRTCQHLTSTEAKHRAAALGLFGLPD